MPTTLSATFLLWIPLAPLAGAIAAGFFGRAIGRTGAHLATIAGVAVAFVLSAMALYAVVAHGAHYNAPVYTWATVGGVRMEVGFLVDSLTALMMCVVTFVSLMVHVYTIGYMVDDPGYQRFFSYISLFTFSMLMLVMSNNLLQLFFGWEAVGLVSYLLIGFWFTKPTAVVANMKAFLVNRVGDFGFILGIGLLVAHTGTLDYAEIFARANTLVGVTLPGTGWLLITTACICLFIGAMGKSAQFPLHVWLPDSMEGPTPISALIHAATMVTAGIFMVARMSPLFELSDTVLSVILVIGAITALFMGLLGVIQNDIKRVIAYSTLSQLGYMTVALGASAYSVAVFHLMTHAFFKALLFLGAGSVIIGMHHDQDIRNMGGLARYMPVTWITSLIGTLALIGMPFFAGFYSKDDVIDAVGASHLAGSGVAYVAVLLGVFVTSFYSFRLYFLVFHGKERFRNKPFPGEQLDDHVEAAVPDAHGGKVAAAVGGHGAHATAHADAASHAAHAHDHGGHDHDHGVDHAHAHEPHESPWVVTLPLVLLAIPSVVIGFMTIEPLLFGDYFRGAIYSNVARHPAMEELAHEFHGAVAMGLHGFLGLPFWLALAGAVVAFFFYMVRPSVPAAIAQKLSFFYRLLDNKYHMDWINQHVVAGGARLAGRGLWRGGDMAVIDGAMVNGSANLVGAFSGVVRRVQTGHLYWYALVMVLGVIGLMTWQLWPFLFARAGA